MTAIVLLRSADGFGPTPPALKGRAPPIEFNASAATPFAIRGGGTRIAVWRSICAELGAHYQLLLGR